MGFSRFLVELNLVHYHNNYGFQILDASGLKHVAVATLIAAVLAHAHRLNLEVQ